MSKTAVVVAACNYSIKYFEGHDKLGITRRKEQQTFRRRSIPNAASQTKQNNLHIMAPHDGRPDRVPYG